MELSDLDAERQAALEHVLGYLNFGSGSSDAKFLANLNQLYARISADPEPAALAAGLNGPPPASSAAPDRDPNWRTLGRLLAEKLQQLSCDSSTFTDSHQATAVLQLVLQHVIPGYRQFHQDLLFHQSDDLLFGPFMFGRICEAVLSQGPPWDQVERITSDAITTLNDYLGHRPVAALETRKLEPYPHEWTRPIPLYIQGAGVAVGPYHEMVERAIKWLEQTEDDLRREAYFDLARLRELAVDARAYDFEHPANKRPNYHFGQWDPHCIDRHGYYCRFVVQQVTLDSLLNRVEHTRDLPREQLLDEAAAVLGGTILMASGVSGNSPSAHDSTTTLGTLLPRIATYRDQYYEQLLDRFPAEHARRLREEAVRLHQALGGARQALNAQLARRRACQLEHVQLAKLFARMGYPSAARQQAEAVHVASARMLCQIDCCLTQGKQAIEKGQLEEAANNLQQITDLLHRAIDCGAVVDPWNILGFDANFSLFPAVENGIRDHRVDELIILMSRIFALLASVWSEAAAVDDQPLCARASTQFEAMAQWWHQFAAHEVQSVDATSALDAYRAAHNVAEALNLWHQGGAEAGDVAFWAPHAEMFESPKSYTLVITTLLDRGDRVTAMALLMHWLSRADQVPLEKGDCSFHALAQQWMRGLTCFGRDAADEEAGDHDDPGGTAGSSKPSDRRWALIVKFFDYLEANAGSYWNVPQFRLSPSGSRPGASLESGADEDESLGDETGAEGELFGAAYQDVVYRDSTDDGVDSQLFDFQQPNEDELDSESERVVDRLAFLDSLARLWRMATWAWACREKNHAADPLDDNSGLDRDLFGRWSARAATNRERLLELLTAVQAYRIAVPRSDLPSMLQYDRQRMMKEALLDQIIATCVATMDAERRVIAITQLLPRAGDHPSQLAALDALPEDEQSAIQVFCHALRRDVDGVRQHCLHLFRSLANSPILYVPVSKGGVAREIVTVQVRQRTIGTLLVWLPRLGLITETRELLEIAREMERNVPVGPGAVTQYDELFENGFCALVQAVVRAAETLPQQAAFQGEDRPIEPSGQRSHAASSVEADLVDCLEHLTESLLEGWLAHSKTLRLSVLEKVANRDRWDRLVRFIRQYGADIFTQQFLNLSNLRAVLHQGVDAWLKQQEESDAAETSQWQLFRDLGGRLAREDAVEQLSVILEAVVENYTEYRDYNSTTTNSDRGEMLYSLLDFVRLRVSYDRVVWNLKPVILAHEILVQRGHDEAAQLWRRALNERVSEKADRYQQRLVQLQEKYAMRLATVADRLGERFVRTMVIDRMAALVAPAMDFEQPEKARRAFEILRDETALLVRDPAGAGLDPPAWLIALEEEVEKVRRGQRGAAQPSPLDSILPWAPMTLDELQTELDQW